MKAVIQCAGRKDSSAGSFAVDGRTVKFVGQPDKHPPTDSYLLARPDDLVPQKRFTWRDYLAEYNQRADNPDRLFAAGRLYTPSAYGHLVAHLGIENVYILSAGWGLVRADYLLPDYDITFSSQGEPWTRRRNGDYYADFSQLRAADMEPAESLYFFGGNSYLSLFTRLVGPLPGRKVVYYTAGNILRDVGFEYVRYDKPGTNWHYNCVSAFIDGTMAT